MSESSKKNQNPIASKIQVGILGVGAIGSVVVTGLLKNENIQLYYFNRTPKELVKVQFHSSFFSFSPKNINAISSENQLDWLIICLKAYHFEVAKTMFEKLIFPKTKIAVIRNGLNLKAPLLPYADEHQILECMIDCPVQIDKEGIYQQMRSAKIAMPKIHLANEFEQLFQNENFYFFQLDDFKTATWKKLIESASIGAITCLTGETCWIFEKKEMRDLYRKLVLEGIQVAKADGAMINSDFGNELLEKLVHYPKTKGSSMLTDRKLGRPIELGAKSGVISELGKEYIVETPLHDLVVLLLRNTNQGSLSGSV